MAAPIAAARKAKSLRRPRHQNGAGHRPQRPARCRAASVAISTVQNIRKSSVSDDQRGSAARGSNVEPLGTAFGTTNPLIHMDKVRWFQGSKPFPSCMYARGRIRGRTRITRGADAELLEPRKKRSDFSDLSVPRVVPSGSIWNRHPGPARCPRLACQLTGLPTGRGQGNRERRGARDKASVVPPAGSGFESAIAHRATAACGDRVAAIAGRRQARRQRVHAKVPAAAGLGSERAIAVRAKAGSAVHGTAIAVRRLTKRKTPVFCRLAKCV